MLVTTPAEPLSYTGCWLPHLQYQRVTQGVGYHTCRTSESHDRIYTCLCRCVRRTCCFQRPAAPLSCAKSNERPAAPLSCAKSNERPAAPLSCAKSNERRATAACPRKVPVDRLETSGACCKHPVHVGDIRCMLETLSACWRPGACFVFCTKNNNLPLTPHPHPLRSSPSRLLQWSAHSTTYITSYPPTNNM